MKKHNLLDESILEPFKHFGSEAFSYIEGGALKVRLARLEEIVYGQSNDFVLGDICVFISQSIYKTRMMDYEEA